MKETALEYLKRHLEYPHNALKNTLTLLQEQNTIAFISRYRKEMTGNLDEVAIEQIFKKWQEYQALEQRREAILKNLGDRDLLTPELKVKLEAALTMTALEDLYLPFKKARKTRADKAREQGLEPLAKMLMAQGPGDPASMAQRFCTKEVGTPEEALGGARDIIAEWINENTGVREQLRNLLSRRMVLHAKMAKGKEQFEESSKYRDYEDFSELLHKSPSHRILAMLRGESEGILKLKVETEEDMVLHRLERIFVKGNHPTSREVQLAVKDAWKRLLAPALFNEALTEAKKQADKVAIQVFASNLRQLLLAPPLGEKRILAIDPGFKSGCKIVCLDAQGKLLHNENIYPHPPQNEKQLATKKIVSLVNAYKIEAIAIGNGTASRETEAFVKKIPFTSEVKVFVVNEAGASVYSASPIAREEFPHYDVTVRGAVSIGRRLADPLAELVKIDPKSIGVGQYQHDVDQNALKEELDLTVASCVNQVGVNLNTASESLLSYVSGIGTSLAKNIVEHRNLHGAFAQRTDLLTVKRLGQKAFEQSAGFLRIRDGKQPLDGSAVHPDHYPVVMKMAKDLKCSVEDLIGNRERIAQIAKERYLSDTMGALTLGDILNELEKPGLDPRKTAQVLEFDPSLKSMGDLKIGQTYPGLINNITNFGCFVDLGIKESGLIHISQLKDGYVSDVNEVVRLHQHVEVQVLEVDMARKRIGLKLIK